MDPGHQSVDDPSRIQGQGNATILDEDDAKLAQIDDVPPQNLDQPIARDRFDRAKCQGWGYWSCTD